MKSSIISQPLSREVVGPCKLDVAENNEHVCQHFLFGLIISLLIKTMLNNIGAKVITYGAEV